MKIIVDPILAQYYGRRVNLVRSLYLLKMPAGAGTLWQGLSPLRDLRPLGGSKMHPSTSSGQNFDGTLALNAAFGEALERHGASFLPRRSLITGTHRELSKNYLLPSLEELRLFSDEQIKASEKIMEEDFGFDHLTADDSIDWVAGKAFESHNVREILYPYDRIALNNRRARFDITTTNGFALASDPAQAAEGALAELAERHALLHHWWHSLPAPVYSGNEILTAQPESQVKDILRLAGERLLILDFSDVWNVPVFGALFLGRPQFREPAFVMGTACHANPWRALEKSVLEGYRIFFNQSLQLQVQAPKNISPPYDKSVRNFDDAAQFFASENSRHAMQFFLDGPRPGPMAFHKRMNTSQVSVQKKLLAEGKKIYQFDMTPVDLALGGLHLSRAVMPEAIPLNLSHRLRPFGCPALRQYSLAELNSMPHPCL